MMRLFSTMTLAALLAACGSKPVTMTYGDEKNPARVTAVSGLKSHDAANVMGYHAYIDGQKTKPQKAVCTLKAKQGETLSITGLSEFTCWAPEEDKMAKPVQAEGEAMQAARAIREGIGGTLRDATPALAIVGTVIDRNSARKAATRQAEIEAETERERIAADSEREAALIDAANKDPLVVEKPVIVQVPGGSTVVPQTTP